MKIIAIDSDPIALDVIEAFCLRLELPGLLKFSKYADGYAFAISDKPDIVFLDVDARSVCALQVAAGLPQSCCVIFTSTSNEYALAGFNLDIVDYLQKPFSFERFKRAIAKADRRRNFNSYINEPKSIIIKQEYNNVPVAVNNILFVEAMENYSKIHTNNNKIILTHDSLKNMLIRLSDFGFIRIHRSFIIPKNKIESFTRRNVKLKGGEILPVGRQFASSLIQKFT